MTVQVGARREEVPWYKSLRHIFTTTHHTHIGMLYIAFSFIFLLVGGAMALLMRWELAKAGASFLEPSTYASLFTVHGTLMIFFWATPVFFGFANYLLPKMIGAPDLYYPKLNALSFWLLPVAAALLLLGWPAIGWTGYAPLSVTEPGVGVDMWILSLHIAGTSSIIGSLNFIVTTWRLRNPRVTWSNLPLFVWSMIVTAFIVILAVPVLAFGLTLLLLDRNFGTNFYITPEGDPILWQHLFWFFGHPEVYILVLPAFGLLSEILPRLVKRPIYGYKMIAYSTIMIGVLSFGVWAHHMFTTGLSIRALAPFMIITMTIAIPTGIKVINWEATLVGARIRYNTPTLFSLSAIASMIVGGITGVFHAGIPVDWQLQDTYWVVGHFHLVLFGVISQVAFAGIYYYYPIFTKRMYSETLGKVHFATANIGQYLLYGSMLALGLMGMPRRYFDYLPEFQPLNTLASFGAFVIGIGTLLFVINLLVSWRLGPKAGEDPWEAEKTGQPDFLGEYYNKLDQMKKEEAPQQDVQPKQ
ncbi:MAG TPA: cytochrome-c oxidase [Candidatus Caldiarchaeum subterraneum]|uniref:Cytochrome-c oxidase n=1 Tax=Caldiarchaeum subterraneum TaxID=311458 RepID=A0A832ZVC5_CALS0|nr:cytochrome-c oxidase [Candidatus Caldarchaeum subterraneum]